MLRTAYEDGLDIPAFPSTRSSTCSMQRPEVVTHDGPVGMSLRDWYAGMAMQTLLALHANQSWSDRLQPDQVAEQAYDMAESMLQERNVWQEMEIDQRVSEELRNNQS
jgi:hypothetical protein